MEIDARSKVLEIPALGFGPQDIEGVSMPHNDVLMVYVTLANHEVARVFMDVGSSINVIFQDTFEWMQLNVSELQPIAASLFVFAHEVRSRGQINLSLSLGKEPMCQ